MENLPAGSTSVHVSKENEAEKRIGNTAQSMLELGTFCRGLSAENHPLSIFLDLSFGFLDRAER